MLDYSKTMIYLIDAITQSLSVSIASLIIALFIFYRYYKKKAKLSLYFGWFFLLFSLSPLLKSIGLLVENDVLLFAHKLAFLAGSAAILQGLSSVGVQWIKKYHAALLTLGVAVIVGGIEAFYLQSNSSAASLAIMAASVMIAAHYFNVLGTAIPSFGRKLMFNGFMLLGLMQVAKIALNDPFFVLAIFYLEITSLIMTGFGWLIVVREKEKQEQFLFT